MPLTHVCVWDSKIGYRRVSVEEASKLYPYEVAANRSHFVCELCAQNVGFSKARVDTGTRYFFHSSAAQNKDCEDRQVQLSKATGQRLLSLNSHVMPLRISVSGSKFSLEIGFFYPPDTKSHCDKIKIAGDSHQVYEYSFERIEQVGITYLNVGSIPSRIYSVEYINANAELKRYWSNKIPGINRNGSLFDGNTGRIIQPGAKAFSGNFYYLLRRQPLSSYITDISATEITKIQSSYTTWYLYKVGVKKFSECSAKFFLKHEIFLTEKPTNFYPIWPPYTEDPYFIYHNSNEFYFFLCGDDAELKSFPASVKATGTRDGKLYKLYTREKEQLVSFGKSGALGFSYLIKRPLGKVASAPSVTICDHAGSILDEDLYTKVPKSKFISVSCQYDGKAVVQKNGRTMYIYKLSAEHPLTIDRLSYGTEIHFYLGSDHVRSIRFEQESTTQNTSALDDALVKKLQACSDPKFPITHAIGTLANKYSVYPETKQWLYKAMRQGEISRKALELLRTNIPNLQEGNK